MTDLLGAVKGKSAIYQGMEDDPDIDDIEDQVAPPPTDAEREMQEFFKRIEQIKLDLAAIKDLQKEVLSMHERGKTIVKSKEMQKHPQDNLLGYPVLKQQMFSTFPRLDFSLQDKINEVNKLAHAAKAKIEALDKENEAAKKRKGQGQGTASERTRTTITAGLKKKLKDHMQEFSDLRSRIQSEYREIVERRVYTVTGQHVDEEEIDRMIENGDSENIFQKAILEQGRGRVLDTLAEIQERHRAVKVLEQSLLELHQIFLDMAVLVEAQGEMLDNIEKQVARSVDYVKGGTEALQDAKQLQKNTRKWMCCAIMIMLIVALVIVLAVVRPWRYLQK
ncbi:Qa-SNARE, Sso1/Syntaxin1-type [Volvox carteri f. nagariensis]|uniref:Qa-SNARE, Sso1/Syntaxin1-type n=1 Tax=Volvox carteri f. nagariensis TaxID=3068 RepID=D8TQR6_VOLCA|nr:Qa-SNARE, Sso1/Syntaxin1-type [Volvox carteri f. nagariensis]EFJ50200.1 Qa-SNARE, Sso1/Syntaxin1-type [Volvox carteri f. nagariensis]|eukprot:XP_002948820.1 Qa-SNARE, Sso1/Syntaxin1-type [Volvox carteri f. nagariensis]